MALAGLLHVYFKTISIQSELSLGILQFNDNPNSDGAPHIWLEINGQIIDNCFAYIPPEKGSQIFYFKMKEKILYVKEDPETTTRKLFSSDEVLSLLLVSKWQVLNHAILLLFMYR